MNLYVYGLTQVINILFCIKFKELNAQANIEEFDDTYLKNISDNKMEKDIDIWNNSVDLRIKDSDKLIN